MKLTKKEIEYKKQKAISDKFYQQYTDRFNSHKVSERYLKYQHFIQEIIPLLDVPHLSAVGKELKLLIKIQNILDENYAIKGQTLNTHPISKSTH